MRGTNTVALVEKVKQGTYEAMPGVGRCHVTVQGAELHVLVALVIL